MSHAMTLRESLAVINAARALPLDAATLAVGLATGFTPLHLEHLLQAQVQQRRPEARVRVEVGTYGDLAGGLEALGHAPLDLCAVVLEWQDLDPRLGLRDAVAAPRATIDDTCATVATRLARLTDGIVALAARTPTVVALPSLDLPPHYAARPGRVGPLEARLTAMVAAWAAELTATSVVVADQWSLEADGAGEGRRRDLAGDLRSGFPYTVTHAGERARLLADLLLPAPSMKGLITDLDDTLWRGLVGEVGPDAVTWDLDSGSAVHALYQQLLAALADRGVLVAVASKNEPAVVERALARVDLLVDPGRLFPIEVSWGSKSAAVGEILRTWNIGPSDVVFVDDNPLELAEVAAGHPGIRTLQFTPHEPAGVAALLHDLGALFWRDSVTEEDRLRLESIRAGAALDATRAEAVDQRAFLADLGGAITIDLGTGWEAPRALELVNKTNQFNLNGRRVDDRSWRDACTRPGAVGCVVSYADRFGPLGAISVLGGVVEGTRLTVETWVLSCRAFSRAIEHHVLDALGPALGVDEIVFDVVPTERNGVVRDLIGSITDAASDPPRLEPGRLAASDRLGIHAVTIVS